MKNQEGFWKVAQWVGILLIVFLVVVSLKTAKSIGYVGKNTNIINTISVSGKGESVSIPDIAVFSFSVTETAVAVDDAQEKATVKINNTLKALKDGGVKDNDIKTTSYNISPHYEYTQSACPLGGACIPGKSTLTGYDVSQTIEVKIRDLKKAGTLFATVGSLGVQNVNGLTFSIDDIETVKAQARKLAIEDAQQKAKILAKQLGVSILRVNSFNDESVEPVYYNREVASDMMTLKASGSAPAPEIPAGEQKIISRVSISYEIK